MKTSANITGNKLIISVGIFALCFSSNVNADGLSDYFSDYYDAGTGTYLIDGSGTSVAANVNLGDLTQAASIVVSNGAKLEFKNLSGLLLSMGTASASLSIVAESGGDVSFRDNSYNGWGVYGGVIRKASSATLNLAGVTFSNNTATGTQSGVNSAGGVIYHTGGVTNLTDVSFVNNALVTTSSNPSAVSYGGAIYVAGGTININTTSAGGAYFSGNTAGGIANSLNLSRATLNVDTAGGSVLDMLDPMSGQGGVDSQSATAVINKIGSGVWRLGGNSVFTSNVGNSSTKFNVKEGTLYLYSGGEASTVSGVTATEANISLAGNNSNFLVDNGANLVVSGRNTISVLENTTDAAIEFKEMSTIQLLEDAQLFLGGNVKMNNATSLSFAYGDSAMNSADNALIIITGTLTLEEESVINVVLNDFTTGIYQLIVATSIVSSDISTQFSSNQDHITYSLGDDGRSVWVTIGNIPEAKTWGFIVGGTAFLITCLLRGRKFKGGKI